MDRLTATQTTDRLTHAVYAHTLVVTYPLRSAGLDIELTDAMSASVKHRRHRYDAQGLFCVNC